MRSLNTRHAIDPAIVANAVARRLAEIDRQWQQQAATARELTAKYLRDVSEGTAAKNWIAPPCTPDEVEQQRLAARATEERYYAKVRVVELPREGDRFVLVYGNEDDETATAGTGPFETFDKAVAWFAGLGR